MDCKSCWSYPCCCCYAYQRGCQRDCSRYGSTPSGQTYRFFLEIDGGTERIRSQKDIDSWERKIRLYDQLQDVSPARFRVLIVPTRSSDRISHILDAVAKIVRNPNRSLFYGCGLPEYLAQADGLRAA